MFKFNMNRMLALVAMLSLTGCANLGQYQAAHEEPCSGTTVVEHGRPNRIVDGAGWILGIPQKVLLWDRRAANHDVHPETVGAVVNYLDAHEVQGVKVRVNQYDPIGEWRRLRANKEISPGWRYTFGALDTAIYTIIPGRLFGNDYYNPFTKSLNLYSDLAPVGLVESAYAQDVSQRKYPGLYATTQQFPVARLWRETIATDAIMNHYKYSGTEDEFHKARHILYSKYGMMAGNDIGSLFISGASVGPAIAGAVIGHAHATRLNANDKAPKTVATVD